MIGGQRFEFELPAMSYRATITPEGRLDKRPPTCPSIYLWQVEQQRASDDLEWQPRFYYVGQAGVLSERLGQYLTVFRKTRDLHAAGNLPTPRDFYAIGERPPGENQTERVGRRLFELTIQCETVEDEDRAASTRLIPWRIEVDAYAPDDTISQNPDANHDLYDRFRRTLVEDLVLEAVSRHLTRPDYMVEVGNAWKYGSESRRAKAREVRNAPSSGVDDDLPF